MCFMTKCGVKQNVFYDQNMVIEKMCYLKQNVFHDQNVVLSKMC